MSPDLTYAAFRAHAAGDSAHSRRTSVSRFVVEVTTGSASLMTRVSISVSNPNDEPLVLELRMPVPSGAAAGEGVVEVGRADAGDVSVELVDELVLSRRSTHRVVLEWAEPVARVGPAVLYRLPVIGDRGRLIALPDAVYVDGERLHAGPAGPAPALSLDSAKTRPRASLLSARAEDGRTTLLLAERLGSAELASSGVDHWYPLRTVAGHVVWIARCRGEACVTGTRADVRELERLFERAAISGGRERDRFGTPRPLECGPISNISGVGSIGTGLNHSFAALRGEHIASRLCPAPSENLSVCADR